MALGGCNLAAEAIAIAVDGVFPGTEQFTATLKPRLPEAALVCEAFGVTAEVAQKVGPADLAAGRVREP